MVWLIFVLFVMIISRLHCDMTCICFVSRLGYDYGMTYICFVCDDNLWMKFSSTLLIMHQLPQKTWLGFEFVFVFANDKWWIKDHQSLPILVLFCTKMKIRHCCYILNQDAQQTRLFSLWIKFSSILLVVFF